MLEALPDRAFTLVGKTSGVFDRTSLPAEETLTLKPGAQVMLVNNDKYGRWVNGSLGIVRGLARMDGEDDRVLVRLNDGKTVEVTPNMWELFEYQYDRKTKKISTRTTGTFTQYPVRLAWAVTIHKSQGKTFDHVVIDMGRGAFAHGQVYVALSRCTSFDGIILTKKSARAIYGWTGESRNFSPCSSTARPTNTQATTNEALSSWTRSNATSASRSSTLNPTTPNPAAPSAPFQ
jgi:hypothetical protein